MAAMTSQKNSNYGMQLDQNYGNITANFERLSDVVQSESPLNQECLRDLRTTNPYDDKSRIQATNGGLLKDSYRWILDNEEFKQWQNSQGTLLWIRGDPGKGKTMLLCGIIDEIPGISEEDTSISFFFCQATDPRINTATAVLRGLIFSLILKKPSLLSHVRVKYEQTGKQLFDDINAWGALTDILTDILDELACTYLLVDALDECTTGLSSLIDFIIQHSAANQRVKWVVTSRNWPEIYEPLQIATGVTPISLELNESSVSEGVNSFIQHKVSQLAVLKKYNDETQHEIGQYLSS
ncbi:NACHT nucleoside triphosphatase [Penicillium cosmopolitanum]|uniref:NACHT nucleoside triphosphatase n=1 Tax=Penicillium cosmopolitanum TaxID=1131564 RepID=A0A9W9W929_9EURO|nr:NACHT nucleoside triphosphatase [Penicillium cosmopolitanum]KAJ5408544.1 NACHT nucleoside triphosphatase [Penicillium cosmopolitanum]